MKLWRIVREDNPSQTSQLKVKAMMEYDWYAFLISMTSASVISKRGKEDRISSNESFVLSDIPYDGNQFLLEYRIERELTTVKLPLTDTSIQRKS